MWLTVAIAFIALIATSSCILASMFAVSRMLAMLAEMDIIPHSHLGMPGDIQQHTLVYVAVLAAFFAAFFCLTMDMMLQWGVLTRLHKEVSAYRGIIATALVLDGVALLPLAAPRGLRTAVRRPHRWTRVPRRARLVAR